MGKQQQAAAKQKYTITPALYSIYLLLMLFILYRKMFKDGRSVV
jgi:hypothetical protein